MKLTKIAILTTALSLSLASCKKELNQFPNTQLPADVVYNNISAAETVMNGCYTPLRGSVYYGRGFTVMNDLTTDNLIAASWFSNSYSSWQNNSYNSSTYEARDVWQVIYGAIHRVNLLLKNIDGVPLAIGEDAAAVALRKKEIKAQCYALRAFYYFDLMRTYAKIDLNDKLGVPMVVEPTTESNVPRLTVKANYDQIVADLTLAESLVSTVNAKSQIKVNKNFINALQSRVYLYYKDYANASKAADKVIAAGFTYETTATDFNKIWVSDESAKEIIFKIGIEAVKESPSVNLGVFFINDSGGSLVPNPDYIPSLSIINLFAANDFRTAAFFKVLKLRQFATPLNVVNKYPGNPAYSAYADKANAPKLLRFAEVALNKMEADYYLDKNSSKTLLKQIRVARIPGYNTALVDAYDDATLLAQIRIERRKELAFEGHEFFDLKRWGVGFSRPRDGAYQAVENALGDVPATNYRFVWPIPQAERESNKVIDQNPGYGG